MHTLENSPVIVLNQTTDLRVKKSDISVKEQYKLLKISYSASPWVLIHFYLTGKKENCNYSSAVHAVILTGLTGFPVFTPIVTGF